MAASENTTKGSSAVHISELGFEDGSERFRDDFDPENDIVRPSVCLWRNNLTALSQRYNLYFVASQDKVQVYRPSFPFQDLGPLPALVFTPPFARVARGYIDENIPHGINHMVIGDLGNEEVLLLSCDDGNVSAFHTKTISDEIERRQNDLGSPGSGTHEVRTFFSESVPRSAWGLAIHTRARMIAVSSNTSNHHDPNAHADITIFAFCLVDPGLDPSSEDSMESDEYLDDDVNEWKRYDELEAFEGSVGIAERRRYNIRITLQGHRENIPSVSFFNSDLDTEGRWLVSTDIMGRSKVWDIWFSKGSCIGELESSLAEGHQPGMTRGWTVLCLDPRAFRETTSLSETLGKFIKGDQKLYLPIDISDSTLLVSNSSRHYPGTPEAITSLTSDADMDDFDSGSEEGQPEQEDAMGGSTLEYVAVGMTSPENERASSTSDSDGDGGVILRSSEYDHQSQNAPADDHADSDDENLAEEVSEKTVTSAAVSGSQASQNVGYGRRTIQTSADSSATPTSSNPQSREMPLLPFAILRTTEASVFLHPDPLAAEATISCIDCLSQELPLELRWLYKIDRLNIAVQIPELGVVIVASQIGRAAVLVLTRLKNSNLIGFKVQWILPLRTQEEKGQRPSNPLLGLAVAPIQGREIHAGTEARLDPPVDGSLGLDGLDSPLGFQGKGERESWRGVEEARRYRLLLTYWDHSVLSYEISRSFSNKGGAHKRADPNPEEDFVII